MYYCRPTNNNSTSTIYIFCLNVLSIQHKQFKLELMSMSYRIIGGGIALITV
jgi:hypothetical protein